MPGERRGHTVVRSSFQKEGIRLSEQNRTITERRHVELPLAFEVNERGLPEAVFKLRKRLYIKAKQEPRFRFYTLYDRILRPDVLAAAWDQVVANDGAPGVDGVRVKDIENAPGGVERFVEDLHDDLKRKRYRPQAVRLFEADFLPVAYGFRPGRTAHDALDAVQEGLRDGLTAVYDADLKGYFDTIPPVDGVCRAADRRRCGAQADTSVATGTDHGRTIRPTSTTEEGQATGRHPARGRHQSVVSQPVSALDGQTLPRTGRTGPEGRGTAGALCR